MPDPKLPPGFNPFNYPPPGRPVPRPACLPSIWWRPWLKGFLVALVVLGPLVLAWWRSR